MLSVTEEYIPSNSRVMNKWKGCGSDDDFVWDSILMIAWKDLGKAQKPQDNQCIDWDLKYAYPKYESEELTFEQCCLWNKGD
jgi:hypothetical protein